MTTKVADIEDGQTTLNLILMVKEIRSTKNGHKFVEFEDDKDIEACTEFFFKKTLRVPPRTVIVLVAE